MSFKPIDQLKSCLPGDVPCSHLRGVNWEGPADELHHVWCARRMECGRGMCFAYEAVPVLTIAHIAPGALIRATIDGQEIFPGTYRLQGEAQGFLRIVPADGAAKTAAPDGYLLPPNHPTAFVVLTA